MNPQGPQRKSHPSEPVRMVVTTPEAFQEVVDHFGILLTPYQAGILARVSKQRIHRLIVEGKFTKIVLFGLVHISQKEFEEWARSSRKTGRPRTPEKQ